MGVQFSGNILVQSNGGPLPISSGGTGQTTAPTALKALLPLQTGNAGKVLLTDGVNASWQASAVTGVAGANTQIQFNDFGAFGATAALTINKTTGVLTSTSTINSAGLQVTADESTVRALKFQTAASDRWMLQADGTAEAGAAAGSNFEFVRVADNGLTQNRVFTVARATGVVDFKVAPTVNGSAISSTPDASVLTGTTLAATVTASSLTSVGTLTDLTVTNPIVGSITGNAATATKLATARNINGVAFDGTANITINASIATNLAAGSVGQVPYQTAANTTGFVSNGTAGQVLTSTGNAAPTWQTAGGFTGGTVTGATIFSSVAPQITLGSAGGSAQLTTPAAVPLTISPGATGVTQGGAVTITGGAGGGSYMGGAVTITGGTARNGGAVNITGGGGGAGPGGDVILTGSNVGNGSGTVAIVTGNVERFRVLGNGAWSVGSTSTAYGTTGQVLTSNGNAAPTWQAVTAGAAAAGTLTGTTLAANVVASSLTSVGTLSSLSVTGNLTLGGNLTVNGTTTTINATTLDVADLNITVAKGATTAAAANGAGLTVNGAAATMLYTSATDTWNFNKSIVAPNVSGVNTGDQTSVTGNAGTATALATARTINGVAFDGTADITIAVSSSTITGTIDGGTY